MSQIDPAERFVEMFGAAFDRAHRRTDGSDVPSERLKDRVMRDIARATTRSETADPSVLGPGHMSSPSLVMNERSLGMDMAMSAPLSTHSRSRSQLWTVLVAGVAVLVVLAAFRMALPPASPGGDSNNLAMAPMLATPMANACTVEPLTADEVMDMVKSPLLGYNRLDPLWGDTDMYEAGASTIRGQIMERSSYIAWLDDESPYYGVPDSSNAAYATDARAAVDQFWTCVLYGSAYQVWGLISPEFVQAEVLSLFSVFRTEDEVMDAIQKLGPMPYAENGYRTFVVEDSGTSEPLVLQSVEGDEGVWIAIEGPFENRLAIVELSTENSDDAENPEPRRILMQRFGDDQWIVQGVNWEMERP